jgi:hypothetical protein
MERLEAGGADGGSMLCGAHSTGVSRTACAGQPVHRRVQQPRTRSEDAGVLVLFTTFFICGFTTIGLISTI